MCSTRLRRVKQLTHSLTHSRTLILSHTITCRMDNAFLFAENTTGICAEEDYPYAGHKHWLRGCFSEQGLCNTVQHTRVQSFIDVGNTVDDLLDALAEQPVSVAIEADQQVFQFYKSGVFADDACGDNLDHGVLAVGYGTEDGQDYFKVRNSWGATWGEEGAFDRCYVCLECNFVSNHNVWRGHRLH